jgi:hypothetical protein
MKKSLLLLSLFTTAAFAQSLPLKDLGLTPTIKVIPSPEVKKQAAPASAVAASAVVVIPAKPVK